MTTSAPATDRAAINRANSQHSTGPVTESGKARSSINALSHGLTAESPVLPTEDLAAFHRHVQQFLDEHRPAAPTETHLVHDLANTAWRQNRIPLLEAQALSRAANPPSEQARIDFDIVDAHRAIALLGIHGQRLSRQFHKTLEQLLALQDARREREKKDLKDAAAICESAVSRQLVHESARCSRQSVLTVSIGPHSGNAFFQEQVGRSEVVKKATETVGVVKRYHP